MKNDFFECKNADLAPEKILQVVVNYFSVDNACLIAEGVAFGTPPILGASQKEPPKIRQIRST